jgi:hypothetical protein
MLKSLHFKNLRQQVIDNPGACQNMSVHPQNRTSELSKACLIARSNDQNF